MTSPRTDPFGDWPERTTLTDGAGGELLVFTLTSSSRTGRPWADGAWRPPGAPVDATRDVMLHALAGHAVSTSDLELVAALEFAGAERLRHAHVMSSPLEAVPAQPSDGVVVEPLSAAQVARHARRLASIHRRAYPPGHADHGGEDLAAATDQIRAIGRGEVVGPYLAQSRVALVDGAVAGACLLVQSAGRPPDGGPWVVDVFRDPACPARGVGRALLVSVLAGAAAAGLPAVSLAVSHSNVRARAVYAALGFVDAGQSWTLALP